MAETMSIAGELVLPGCKECPHLEEQEKLSAVFGKKINMYVCRALEDYLPNSNKSSDFSSSLCRVDDPRAMQILLISPKWCPDIRSRAVLAQLRELKRLYQEKEC